MAILVPAILETTKEGFLNVYGHASKLSGVERLQVDFGDGVFIPSKLLEIEEMDVLNPAFHWEAHLMIKQPGDFLDYQICGFKTIIIHYEACGTAAELSRILSEIKSLGLKAGLAINPGTSIDIYKQFVKEIDQCCLMSVVPGKQGQSFIESSFGRLSELRKVCPNAIIEVDGGVNETNVKKIAESGADLIAVGSAITRAFDMAEVWQKLNGRLAGGGD